MTLDTYLKAAPGRCADCGFHVDYQGCRCAVDEWATCTADEWAIFTTALRKARREDNTVHQCDVRPLIRGRVEPKAIGGYYRRARSLELIRDTGEKEPSSDVAGRNTDKDSRIYEWIGAAA